MPRHVVNKTKRPDRERVQAFKAAHHRALELADACEETFDAALGASSDMLRVVAGPDDAQSHLDAIAQLRRLVRRLQRRLDSP